MSADFINYKTCTGPAHARPVRLEVNENNWNYHRSGPKTGEPVARCKLCVNWTKLVDPSGPHGLATVSSELRRLTAELLQRCDGSAHRLRYHHGLRPETVKAIAAGEHLRVQKRTAVKILAALAEQRIRDRRDGVSETFRKALVANVQREGRMSFLIYEGVRRHQEREGEAPEAA